MLKRDITYEDFNGERVTDTLYFNLTKTEIIDLEVSHEGGLDEAIKKIVKAQDIKSLIAEFKNIVLASYGVKSEDGKRFIKSDQLREEFTQTAAYDALFMELATDDDAAAVFIKGIIPADLASELSKSVETVPTSFPPVPPQAS